MNEIDAYNSITVFFQLILNIRNKITSISSIQIVIGKHLQIDYALRMLYTQKRGRSRYEILTGNVYFDDFECGIHNRS